MNIDAVVSVIQDPDNSLGGNIQIGDRLTGSYTYDPDLPLTLVDRSNGWTDAYFTVDDEPYGVDIAVNGFRFRSNPGYPHLRVGVTDNYGGNPQDLFSVGSSGYSHKDLYTPLFDLEAPRPCDATGVYNTLSVIFTDPFGRNANSLVIPNAPPQVGYGPGEWVLGDVIITSMTVGYPGCPGVEMGSGFRISASITGTTTPGDTSAPSIACDSIPAEWSAADIAIACTATDTGSGLAQAEDASFLLVTSVPAGIETANAATGSHTVCDQAGNCATAGPFTGLKVDKKAPTISLSSSINAAYVLGEAATVGYGCADAGSGTTSCASSVANGANLPTSAVGSHTLVIEASDAVGNTSSRTFAYTVSYGLCVLYDPTKAGQIGRTIPIKIQLCDASGLNVSSPDIPVTAISVYRVSDSATGALADSGNANPDLNFRFTDGFYLFNLSLKGYQAGTYALTLRLGTDPVQRTIGFQAR